MRGNFGNVYETVLNKLLSFIVIGLPVMDSRMFPFIAIVFFSPYLLYLNVNLTVPRQKRFYAEWYVVESSSFSVSVLVRVMVLHNNSEESSCEVRTISKHRL